MQLTFDDFKDRIGQHFTATTQDGDTLDLELTEAKERPANPDASQGFSLVFRGAGPEVHDQQIFDVDHPDLGFQTIFMVPVAAGGESVTYEAVFTR